MRSTPTQGYGIYAHSGKKIKRVIDLRVERNFKGEGVCFSYPAKWEIELYLAFIVKKH